MVKDKCYRLEYLLTPDRIATIRRVYLDIVVFDNTGEDEPTHGWLMNEPTIPCDHLTDDGCRFTLEGKEKPERCRNFPSAETELNLMGSCSYEFEGDMRMGQCNRCIGK